MHLVLDGEGKIMRLGPTLQKVLKIEVIGDNFCDIFEIEKPRSIKTFGDIKNTIGKKILLRSRKAIDSKIQFRSVSTRVGDDHENLLMDFAFSADFVEFLPKLKLSTSDFKPNDLSLDLIYTIETQRTLVEDSYNLTRALENARKEAEHAANIDLLTGIANRRSLYSFLEERIATTPHQNDWALLHIDLDRFKSINDTWGHSAGDAVLRHSASVLASAAGEAGFASRLGGDEFVVVVSLEQIGVPVDALARTIRDQIAKPIPFQEQVLQVAASIGIVTLATQSAKTPDELLSRSDIALYEAKRTDRKTVRLTKDMLKRHIDRSALIHEIEIGLAGNQFVPFFQPKVDTRRNAVFGVEVLARWQHPERGLVMPADFLEVAQSANLMGGIEKSIITQALCVYREWVENEDIAGRLSINLTAANLYSPAFVEYLQAELAKAGLCSHDIELELLESILFDDGEASLFGRCRELREAGFHLTLDDFGTGYASISSLIDKTIETIKIDRSFITGIDKDERLQRITRSILALSEQLGLNVIAEGVETLQELEVLNAYGCDIIQGHIIGLPRGAEDMSSWFRELRDRSTGNAIVQARR